MIALWRSLVSIIIHIEMPIEGAKTALKPIQAQYPIIYIWGFKSPMPQAKYAVSARLAAFLFSKKCNQECNFSKCAFNLALISRFSSDIARR